MIDKHIIRFFSKEASSSARVKSTTAFYQDPGSNFQAQPLGNMNTGNAEVVNSHIQKTKEKQKERSADAMMSAAPAPPTSIQPNTPSVAPPFKPKYTGM